MMIVAVPPIRVKLRFRAIFSTSREKLLLIGLMLRIFGACPATMRPRSGCVPAGRGRVTGGPARRPLSFLQQVKRAVAKQGGDPRRLFREGGRTWSRSGGEGREGGGRTRQSGRFNARGRGAKVAVALPRENQWTVERGVRFRSRRVVVKARVVKLRGGVSRAADAHLRYLQRDGVTREGDPGQVYSAIQDRANGEAFVRRGREDRHQFRLIVAPEDGVELGNLRDFTRTLMDQMEHDLETRLDWVAVDHHNTGHPHSHVMVRGITDDGKILNIAGDYIAYGIRARASEIVTLELGPQRSSARRWSRTASPGSTPPSSRRSTTRA
jgi:hypothetical protein